MGPGFKPETDDMREAPSLVLIDKLLASGCEVYVYDPVSMEETRRRLGDTIHYAKDIYDAVVDADASCSSRNGKNSGCLPGRPSKN